LDPKTKRIVSILEEKADMISLFGMKVEDIRKECEGIIEKSQKIRIIIFD